MEEREIFCNGFCRAQNQGRTVTCVYVKQEKGWTLDEVDCAFEKCLHRGACDIARQIREGENDQ